MAAKTKTESAALDIVALEIGEVTFHVLGVSPFIYNAMSAKVQGELLVPKGKMTSSEKANNMKHDPVAEFRRSVYSQPRGNTRLIFPSVALKKAVMCAALDMPTSVSKTQIGRLVWAKGENMEMFGVPDLFMTGVRMADIARTPDVRTRARLKTWATEVTFQFTKPMLSAQSLGLLMQAAGLLNGLGDGRQQKGTHSFGQFEIVNPDDPRYLEVLRTGGREAQEAALEAAEPGDCESEALLNYFNSEVARRFDKKAA